MWITFLKKMIFLCFFVRDFVALCILLNSSARLTIAWAELLNWAARPIMGAEFSGCQDAAPDGGFPMRTGGNAPGTRHPVRLFCASQIYKIPHTQHSGMGEEVP
jgi:hypothetical protein